MNQEKAQLFIPGDWVWITDSDGTFVPGCVESIAFDSAIDKRIAQVSVMYSLVSKFTTTRRKDETKPFSFQELLLDSSENIDEDVSFDDMTQLPFLSAPSILHNISKRFIQNTIYTNVSSILISVNPYKQLDMYGPFQFALYKPIPSPEERPHIYQVARNALLSLRQDFQSQSILISGESGSGKTESTKHLLKYLVNSSGSGKSVEGYLLNANPILESFGNAQTARNDNSSRFGRWTSMIFDKTSMCMVSGKLIGYLLEENRVTMHNNDERNFHILYQTCFFSIEKTKDAVDVEMQTQVPSQFAYLNYKDGIIASRDDQKELSRTLEAMELCGIDASTQRNIFRVLKGILYMGNLTITKEENDSYVTVNEKYLHTVSKLLQIDAKLLVHALRFRSLQIASDAETSVEIPHTLNGAIDSRDSLSKRMYRHLFHWLIAFLNTKLEAQLSELDGNSSLDARRVSMDHKAIGKYVSVGVLDIFGFEQFESNGLEQFLINFANESLQQHFIDTIFRIEMDIFKNEAVQVPLITYTDNAETVSLLGHPRNGILAILSDELSIPRATVESFTVKACAKAKFSAKQTRNRNELVISHFAGQVTYCTDDFIEKSRNALSLDLLNVLRNTSSPFLCEIFEFEQKTVKKQSKVMKFVGNALGIGQSHRKISLSLRKREKGVAIGTEFRQRLQALLAMVKATKSHFVRCIKPNSIKKSGFIDSKMVLHQLQSSGMLEAVEIRKEALPERLTFDQFLLRYAYILRKQQKSIHFTAKEQCGLILDKFKSMYSGKYALGRTKVFMTSAMRVALDVWVEQRLSVHIILIQSIVRMYLERKTYKKKCKTFHKLLKASELIEQAQSIPKEETDSLFLECSQHDIPLHYISQIKQKQYHLNSKQALSTALSTKVSSLAERIELLSQINSEIAMETVNDLKAFQKHFEEFRKLSTTSEDFAKQLLDVIRYSDDKFGLTYCEEVVSAEKQAEKVISLCDFLAQSNSNSVNGYNATLESASKVKLAFEQLNAIGVDANRHTYPKAYALVKKAEKWKRKVEMRLLEAEEKKGQLRDDAQLKNLKTHRNQKPLDLSKTMPSKRPESPKQYMRVRSPTNALDFPTMARPIIKKSARRRMPKKRNFLTDIVALEDEKEEMPQFVNDCHISRKLLKKRSSSVSSNRSIVKSPKSKGKLANSPDKKGNMMKSPKSKRKVVKQTSPRAKTKKIWEKRATEENIENILSDLGELSVTSKKTPIVVHISEADLERPKRATPVPPIRMNVSEGSTLNRLGERKKLNGAMLHRFVKVDSTPEEPVKMKKIKQTQSIEALSTSGKISSLWEMFESKKT